MVVPWMGEACLAGERIAPLPPVSVELRGPDVPGEASACVGARETEDTSHSGRSASADALHRQAGKGGCQDFRVRAGIMGKKASHYVPTQGAGDPG